MVLRTERDCPICGGSAGVRAFPYSTRFNNVDFAYRQCRTCGCTFVDPVPDADTFALMYAKATYHDAHYKDVERDHYDGSARLLARFLPKGANVLDYGCGTGAFLQALKAEGFLPTGVEFDHDAADFAARNVGCPAFAVTDFMSAPHAGTFDALHLGDVLEHLPQPQASLCELLAFLKPGGLLFVEGPLENNASPVFWAARAFGGVKRCLQPNFTAASAPTHLLRVNARQQREFFTLVAPEASQIHWDVYETGWPYASGGALKRVIAGAARLLGGRKSAGVTFGNRFRGVFQLPERRQA